MREQIINSIYTHMKDNSDVFFVTADMGINLVEKFQETYPERYANVGIAEQNMVGVCAGLANLGYRPFAYTISNFAIHRCFEQIRNDIGIHNYPITLLGTSTGYDNAPLGPTHHIIDEWGVAKSIPQIDIYCPSSVSYAARLVERILERNKPAYIRIPKGNHEQPVADDHIVHIEGQKQDILLVSYGNLVQECLEVRKKDPSVSVLVVNRLRPLDEQVLKNALVPYKKIFIVEDHFPESGLYGSLCEFVARYPIQGRLISLAPRDYTMDVGTSPKYFFEKYGLNASGIARSIEQVLKG